MINSAYAGTRVLEIAAGLAAGVAGRFFADLGAEVIRLEPFSEPAQDFGDATVQTWARAGKTLLDGPAPDGTLRSVAPLLPGADLLISDLSPQQWAETLPTPEALIEDNPGLVLVDVTKFGRSGPYAAYAAPSLVSLALSGYLFISGLNDREPLRIGVDLVDVVTGVNAVGGAMAALHHARTTGQGQQVEVSTLRTLLCTLMSFPTSYGFQGTVRRRSSTRTVSVGPLVPAQDGHALVSTFRTDPEMLFVLLEDERLLEERFADPIGRARNQQEFIDVISEAAATRTMRDLFETGQSLRMPNAMVQSPLHSSADPQHAARRFFQPLRLDGGSEVPAPVVPLVPEAARDSDAHRPCVTHTGTTPAWSGDPTPRGSVTRPSRDALEGLKVLELTFAWAGPFAGRILADHGAEVVKVESRRHPDTARGFDLVDLSFGDNDRWMDRSMGYVIANPGKYHLGMELNDPVGKEVLLDLVRWADVVIENLTPRVLPNLGLGWDVFHEVNPSLIMLSATGFGHDGPYRDYGAWGWTLECLSGITHGTGYRDDSSPLLLIPTIPDSFSGTMGVAAVLAALEERRETGLGQWIDLSQYECATFAGLTDVVRAGRAGADRPRTGNRHVWQAPQGVYGCDGQDAWVAVAIETDEEWFRLCEVLGRSDLGDDESLRSHGGRHADHDRIDEAISDWTRTRSKHDAMKILQQHGVPAGAVQHAKDLYHDPQVEALDYFRAAWGTEIGLRIWPGTFYAMSRTPGDVRRGASTFGEDNERVLRDVLGYDPARVKNLLMTDAFSDIQDGLQKPSSPGLSVETMLEQGLILSWDEDYRALPEKVAARNQQWRRANGLPEMRIDGRGR
ncbi:CoA transferase [Pseudonocardia oroxyli]|uniref:Crotonobetainyl-CoA:carnitine CoA-transferase CaiB n=1 Tax=Pseudonocardia oroxyli TaxID=366584 RepID=A0A1G8EKQ1_PSEOR|nr:CoA transferase [Pseudonocardia oroxyli]SDH70533.1 Crotonobetainyl-CoA:carnitine CoA-transferase CaiB [Pseudonocardia oroxyli]